MRGALMEWLTAKVLRVRRETDDIATIFFTVPGRDFHYIAGQYITVFFEQSSTPEGKAYSLSSAPYEKLLSITVKKVGEYSGRLHALREGDSFMISEAYGTFNPQTTKPLVCISAGCGLAPIWSVLKDELRCNMNRRVQLFFSNKTVDSIPFFDDLDACQSAHRSVKIYHYITRQHDVPANMKKGRIDLDQCVSAVPNEVAYLVCGSADFVRDMWRGLVERGVDGGSISTETFFE
jgi:oxidoreductase FAD/NAD(P)-binding domain protein